MSQRRDGKRFEPPPWEREQFDELARQRAAGRTDEEIDAAIRNLEEPPILPETQLPQLATLKPDDRSPVEEARMIEMFSQLSAEEPKAIDELWRLGVFGAFVTAAIGVMLVVLGVVGLTKTMRSGPTGILGGSVLIGFGLGFLGTAVWTVVRTLKQRGVL